MPDRETAEILRNKWLKLWTTKHAMLKCQDIRPVKNIEMVMIETIKYGTKIFTDPTMNKFRDRTVKPFIYASAIDNILTELKNKRLFDHFGFKICNQPEERLFRTVKDFENLLWNIRSCDWENLTDINETLFRNDIDLQIINI